MWRSIHMHANANHFTDPNWMETMKKPHTNCPTFPVFMALHDDRRPSKSVFHDTLLTALTWKKPTQEYVSFIYSPRMQTWHYRMMRLYAEIAELLYPYWAYNTKHNGMGLIVICGQRMFNVLDNFVDAKGELLANPCKLNASFLTVKQFKIYFSHHTNIINGCEEAEAELETATISYKQKSSKIGVLFHFQDVRSMCMRGPVSPNNKDYDRECALFENVMKELKMETCEYLEIDVKRRIATGLSMESVYDDRNIHVERKTDGELLINSRSCGYCKAIKSKMQRCSRCNKMYYCNAKCQRPHWKIHKKHCVPLKTF
eukprot:68671_1